MPLGLDLRGGTHLLYQIDTAQLKKDWLQSLQTEARRALSEERIAHSGVVIAGNQVRVTIRDSEKAGAAFARLKKLATPLSASLLTASNGDVGNDISVTQTPGGVITLEPTPAGLQRRIKQSHQSYRRNQAARQPTGTTEATIQAQGGAGGKDRVLIQVPGLDPAEVENSRWHDGEAHLPNWSTNR